jgi:Tol biopolymer transport system component
VLYLTDVRTPKPRALTDGMRSIGYPAWSPDERRVAVEIKDGSSMQAGVIEVESGAVRQLTSERGQTWVRSWSPDGRKIAAAVLRSGLWSLQWIDAQSGEAGEITAAGPPHVYVRYPDWSRRNDLVVFERGELRGNIWMLPIP